MSSDVPNDSGAIVSLLLHTPHAVTLTTDCTASGKAVISDERLTATRSDREDADADINADAVEDMKLGSALHVNRSAFVVEPGYQFSHVRISHFAVL